MGRNQNSFMKNLKAMKKKKKREEKLQRKIDKKEQEIDGSLDNMTAYIDENGNITDKKASDENEANEKN